jgi:hypothetical protein
MKAAQGLGILAPLRGAQLGGGKTTFDQIGWIQNSHVDFSKQIKNMARVAFAASYGVTRVHTGVCSDTGY